MNRRFFPLILLCLLCMLFCGCVSQAAQQPVQTALPSAAQAEPSKPQPEPPVEPDAAPALSLESEPESDLEPVSEPESEPEPELQPELEPEPYPFTDGPALSVGGQLLDSVPMLEGTYYLPLEALTEHLPVVAAPTDDGGVLLELHGRKLWVEDRLIAEQGDARSEGADAPVTWEGKWYLPLYEAADALGLTVLTDTQYPHVYLADNRQYDPVPEGIRVPVLMYHGIADYPRGNDELFVTPANLEAQIQYLAENGYTAITFEDLPRLEEIEKPVMLTFDDGYDDNYEYLFPLLEKYDMKATIFVISGYVNFTYYCTEAQIKEMSDSGRVSIQSHTDTHPYLDTLDREALEWEFYISWLTITRITGKPPFALCYPSGRQSELVRQVAAERYDYGLIMGSGDYVTGQNSFLMPRHYVSRTTDLGTFAAYIQNAG